jgi:transposase
VERLIERCAGLEVHKASVTATVRVPGDQGGRRTETRTFRATTTGPVLLGDWLASFGVTVVGMESTGISWKPVYYLLEDAFGVWLLNAQHLRNVPGRKTDVADSVWSCRLVEHGLVRPRSCRPGPIRELRDLTRYRKALLAERTREVQRLHKVLEDAGIKLASVASDPLRVSGRAMLEALVQGTHDPQVLAELARGRLRAKLPALREALEGRFGAHHGLLVGEMLARIAKMDETIGRLSAEVARVAAPFSPLLALLLTIPGVSRRTAGVLLAGIGADMGRFPTAAHLACWAGSARATTSRQASMARAGPQGLQVAAGRAGRGGARGRADQGQLPGRPLCPAARSSGSQEGGPGRCPLDPGDRLASPHQRSALQRPGADYFVKHQTHQAYRDRLVPQLERMGHKVTLDPTAA